MQLVALTISIFFFLRMTASLIFAGRGGTEYVINAGLETINALIYLIVGGFSIYFWQSGLLPQMNWFFFIIVVLFTYSFLVSLFAARRHGQKLSFGPGLYAFVAIFNFIEAVGFLYVFLALIQAV